MKRYGLFSFTYDPYKFLVYLEPFSILWQPCEQFSLWRLMHLVFVFQVYVDKLVKVAYENWENVVDYDGEALIGVETYPVKGIDAYTEEPNNGAGVRNPYPQGPNNGTQQQTALPSSQSAPMQQQRSSTSSSGATGSGWYPLKLNVGPWLHCLPWFQVYISILTFSFFSILEVLQIGNWLLWTCIWQC